MEREKVVQNVETKLGV